MGIIKFSDYHDGSQKKKPDSPPSDAKKVNFPTSADQLSELETLRKLSEGSGGKHSVALSRTIKAFGEFQSILTQTELQSLGDKIG